MPRRTSDEAKVKPSHSHSLVSLRPPRSSTRSDSPTLAPPPQQSHVQDVLLFLGLLVLVSLPLAFLFPSTFSSFVQLSKTLWTTVVWLVLTLVVLVVVGTVALVGEKAHKRFVLGEHRPTSSDHFASAGPDATPDEVRRARRVARETRMEAAAEKVVDSIEATGVGKLFRRKTKAASAARDKGKGKAVEQDAVELDVLGDKGTSSGITRAPPPLPPR
ncbi:hypothetical protein JCM10212_004350 [Sporobolomyces blumeae]